MIDASVITSYSIHYTKLYDMALTFLGKHDEAMEIEAFRTEFAARFKDEIDKRQKQKEQGETDQST